MTTMTNAAGDLTLTPALARGVTVANGLRGLMDLDSSDEPADLVEKWRGTAIASVLGQLAATVPASSAQLLRSCCGVAKQRQSLSGIESIFLSALLGTDSATDQSLADATWTALPPPKVRSELLIPVLDPVTAEMSFLSSHDLAGLTGLALKAQLAALRDTRAVSAGAIADQLSFGAAVLLPAVSVMSAALIAPLPDTAPEKATAIAALGSNGESGGLALALVRGRALLVQTELVADVAGVAGTPSGGWESVWPQTETVPTDVSPVEALSHPYWKASQLCPSRPVTGAALAGQVLARQNTLVLQSVPQADYNGSVLHQGFYPAHSSATTPASSGSWRWQASTTGGSRATDVVGARLSPIPTGPKIIIGGTVIDPLTGNPIDAHTGLPIPGQGAGYSPGAVVRRQLANAVQVGRLGTSTQLSDVLERVITTDYEV
jgi:hypothetical protein